MGKHREFRVEAVSVGDHQVELMMPGFPRRETDHLLSLLSNSGQPARLNPFPEQLPVAGATRNEHVNVAVIHLDLLPMSPRDVIRWIRESIPQAQILLATSTPAEFVDIAEAADIPDLIDSCDYSRIALAIRRSYRRIVSHRDSARSRTLSDRPDTSRPNQARIEEEIENGDPASVALRERQQKREPEFCALSRPVVSLDGDTRAHYLLYPALITENANPLEPKSRITGIARADQSAEMDAWLVERAADMLSRLTEKAVLHLSISEQSLENEAILMRTCESLRHFNVRASNLYFDFDVTLLKTQKRDFLRFLTRLRKVNCRISCSNVEFSRGTPELLSKHGVHMAQYAKSTVELALDRPIDAKKLARTNRDIQRRGIKTQAGYIGSPERLALLWQLGVNYGWGDFLLAPRICHPLPRRP